MELALSGRLALVTGGSKGIGLAVTRALVAEGVQVVTGSRSISPALEELAATGTVHPFAVDLSSPDGPASLIEFAEAIAGVDLLVNNAGAVTPRPGGFLSVDDAGWRATLDLGLLAAVRTIRAALPGMLDRDGGDIVTIASVNAVLPDPAGIGVVVVAVGFATVIGLVIHRAVRSARDPEYRASLEAQSAAARRRSSSVGPSSAIGTPYDPASDLGNPASPMFPGNPGNPI